MGVAQTINGVPVTNGLFSVSLNDAGQFGASAFDGAARWLEISVNGTTLAPRQALTVAPNAAYAARAGNAAPWTIDGTSLYYPAATGMVPDGSNCCVAHAGTGCSSPTCQATICALDDFCCTNNWDNQCATEASNLCNSCESPPIANLLGFGAVGNLNITADNTDVIGFERVNPGSDFSELRLILGDNPTGALDDFTIGTVPDGFWAPVFVFRSDGLASKPGGGAWAAISDARVKHDIEPMQGTLDKLLELHGFSYEYNADVVQSGEGLPGRQIGLVAQDVEKVFPEWVSQDRQGRKVVTERATTALMVESLRELRQEKDCAIQEQQQTIAAQQKQIEDLTARLARLEAAMRGAKEATR